MKTELFVITGTSGTGKSTITPVLKRNLPKSFEVYDWDEVLRPYDGTGESWANEVAQRMFQITRSNIDRSVATVVLGLVRPSWIKKNQDKYNVHNIKFCLLDVSEEDRVERLKQRNAQEYLIKDLEELHRLPNWIKDSGFEYVIINTSELNLQEVADKVSAWIQASG